MQVNLNHPSARRLIKTSLARSRLQFQLTASTGAPVAACPIWQYTAGDFAVLINIT